MTSAPNQTARQLFTPIAPSYERWARILSLGQDGRWRRAMVAGLALADRAKVLDVAAGTGSITRRLQTKGCHVVAVDLSEAMLDRHSGPDRVQARAEKLPFRDNTFDGLTFGYLLRYVEDPISCLSELVRVVKAGGSLGMVEFGLPTGVWKAPWMIYSGLILPGAGRFVSHGWYQVGRFLRRSIEEFHAKYPDPPSLWREAGMVDVVAKRLSLGGGLVIWGAQTVKRPAYYAPVGSLSGDLIALLHPPYTAWHLSHVAIGAALAPRIDWQVLAATLLAFFLGTGVAAHAIDERNGRPLHTALSDRTLTLLAVGGLLGSLVVAAIGAVRLSPWVLAWAAVGVLLAAGYGLEKPAALHTSLGFALAWGGFPVLVGFWAQTMTMTIGAVLVAGAATLISMVQRTLSTPARYVRRNTEKAEMTLFQGEKEDRWDEEKILATWERPLRLLGWSMVALATGMLANKLG